MLSRDRDSQQIRFVAFKPFPLTPTTFFFLSVPVQWVAVDVETLVFPRVVSALMAGIEDFAAEGRIEGEGGEESLVGQVGLIGLRL